MSDCICSHPARSRLAAAPTTGWPIKKKSLAEQSQRGFLNQMTQPMLEGWHRAKRAVAGLRAAAPRRDSEPSGGALGTSVVVLRLPGSARGRLLGRNANHRLSNKQVAFDGYRTSIGLVALQRVGLVLWHRNASFRRPGEIFIGRRNVYRILGLASLGENTGADILAPFVRRLYRLQTHRALAMTPACQRGIHSQYLLRCSAARWLAWSGH